MRVDFYGLTFDTPKVTVHLWSPWRSTALEHRLFEVIGAGLKQPAEKFPDGLQAHITDPKTWRTTLQAVSRVLKGWQEDAEPGNGERRSWRWMIEGNTDANGYDHTGEQACVWAFVRLGLDRGEPGEPDKGEDIDLDGFGVQIWPTEA
ncbi:MAG TPA: hypothetical protein VE988_27170 [Gemmataceae bacterium]|nr:hypothetical protein [Gemmataceae bacterium]